MNFVQCGWLDGFELAASLRQRLHLFPAPDDHGCRILDLRWFADEKWKAAHQTKNWVELTNTLSRIKRLGTGTNVESGKIWMEMLDAGAVVPWNVSSGNGYSRMIYAVRTNPAVRRYAGLDSTYIQPGSLILIANTSPQSALNMGEWSAIHLVIEVRQKVD